MVDVCEEDDMDILTKGYAPVGAAVIDKNPARVNLQYEAEANGRPFERRDTSWPKLAVSIHEAGQPIAYVMNNGGFGGTHMRRIGALNRWRSQILRRNLGSAKAARIPFHDDEIEWLYQVHRAFHQAAVTDT
ncbi:hypothetical protein OEA41_004589 [Lepraria neglecta]|uniref:Uncharacterized protein n=1 Tax=Lepraria neglecta TaxID=209136 RepID=A0AAD9Z2A6_9LECA|nr:hypothetical protein OEA41_004589 [Lepraria neglecta]